MDPQARKIGLSQFQIFTARQIQDNDTIMTAVANLS